MAVMVIAEHSGLYLICGIASYLLKLYIRCGLIAYLGLTVKSKSCLLWMYSTSTFCPKLYPELLLAVNMGTFLGEGKADTTLHLTDQDQCSIFHSNFETTYMY